MSILSNNITPRYWSPVLDVRELSILIAFKFISKDVSLADKNKRKKKSKK